MLCNSSYCKEISKFPDTVRFYNPRIYNQFYNPYRFGRMTKFKHFKGTTLPKSMMFDNLKNLSKSMASECDIIKANVDRVAVPLAGPGGKIGVFETSKAGRLPDGVLPSVINGVTVLDFEFDPFDNSRCAALACRHYCTSLQAGLWHRGGHGQCVDHPPGRTH